MARIQRGFHSRPNHGIWLAGDHDPVRTSPGRVTPRRREANGRRKKYLNRSSPWILSCTCVEKAAEALRSLGGGRARLRGCLERSRPHRPRNHDPGPAGSPVGAVRSALLRTEGRPRGAQEGDSAAAAGGRDRRHASPGGRRTVQVGVAETGVRRQASLRGDIARWVSTVCGGCDSGPLCVAIMGRRNPAFVLAGDRP